MAKGKKGKDIPLYTTYALARGKDRTDNDAKTDIPPEGAVKQAKKWVDNGSRL